MMNNLSQEIRQRVSLSDVLSRYGFQPDRRGYINCPFHPGDRDASLRVYKDNTWHCFGCHKYGSVIDFVMEMEHMDFRQACLHLDRMYDLRLMADQMDERQRRAAQKLATQREKAKEEAKFREIQRRQHLLDLLKRRRELHWETILLSVNAYDHEAAQKKALLQAEIERLDYEIEEVNKLNE